MPSKSVEKCRGIGSIPFCVCVVILSVCLILGCGGECAGVGAWRFVYYFLFGHLCLKSEQLKVQRAKQPATCGVDQRLEA